MATMQTTQEMAMAVPVETRVASKRRYMHLAQPHRVVARVLLGAVGVQFFFAGLGVFGISFAAVDPFLPHVIWGSIIIVGSLSLPIVAAIGRLGRATLWQSIGLVALMILQGALIDLGMHVNPIFAAFHPVNAMLLVLVLAHLARPQARVVEF